MSYIDETYYTEEYKGKGVTGEPELPSFIARACDAIDQLTHYKISLSANKLNDFHPFIQEQVKKATAAQTEFLVLNGLYSGNDTTPANVSIGIFNYSGGSDVAISPDAIAFLRPTGLLHAGVDVR